MPTQAEISLNPTSAKGDLISYDGSSRVRISTGTSGQILSASSSDSSGIKWRTYGGASPNPTYALIASAQLTADADTISIASIPQTYQDLYVVFRGQTQSGWAETKFGIRFNSVTTASYGSFVLGVKPFESGPITRSNPKFDSTLANGFGGGTGDAQTAFWDTAYGAGPSDENSYRSLYIPNYSDTSSTAKFKTGIFTMGSPSRVSQNSYWSVWYGVTTFTKTDSGTGLPEAITGITAYGIENFGSPAFLSSSAIYVYGVKRFGS
jgi:hypothetical protein